MPASRARASALGSNKKKAAAWLAGGWKSDSDATEIGRDIQPCMSGEASAVEEKFGQDGSVKVQLDRAVKGMESVGTGLGEIVSL